MYDRMICLRDEIEVHDPHLNQTNKNDDTSAISKWTVYKNVKRFHRLGEIQVNHIKFKTW